MDDPTVTCRVLFGKWLLTLAEFSLTYLPQSLLLEFLVSEFKRTDAIDLTKDGWHCRGFVKRKRKLR
jgi:hypothetical protein